MLFRIDHEHFLTHMIDHFPREVLISLQYAIISAGIRNQMRVANCVKINELYPSTEAVIAYSQYLDKAILKKMYVEELEDSKSVLYNAFVNPVMLHHDVVILCKQSENVYIDILCEYIEETFGLQTINLNDLFIKGRVGPFSINRKEIKNKLVDFRRNYGKDMIREMEATEGGRSLLLSKMSKKDKIRKLKDIGIDVRPSDYDSLDALLEEAWVND